MSARGARFIAALGVLLIRPLLWSLRIQTNDHAGLLSGKLTRPVIWAFWHNRLFLIPFIFRKHFPQTRGAALTSLSKDGEILAAYIGRFGIESVRGSSSRGGRAALIALKRALDAGAVAAITPDGPRGPCYALQPGILKLAQLTGAVILPVHIHYSRAWRLKSWDRPLCAHFRRSWAGFGDAQHIVANRGNCPENLTSSEPRFTKMKEWPARKRPSSPAS